MIANPLFPRESKCNALIEIVLPERVQQRLHLAFDDAVERVERQVHAMVRQAVLREVVGADALGAVASADLTATV